MDTWEYTYIRRKTLLLTGVDLNDYKALQMQRRLQVYLDRSGYPNWARLFQALQRDPVALNQFKNYLTINVSSFFRDPDKYQHLQSVILPEFLRQRSSLRVWSAGCSHGQEAYSIAILLAEMTGSSSKHHILATDIDSSALERARAGGPYLADELNHVPPALRQRYFNSQPPGYQANDLLRHGIIFRQHNLLADPFTGSFDLIICRNVVIYFEAAAKEKLYQRFYEALRPGGVLFVGGTEIISKAGEIGFEAAGISFYRRKGRSHLLK